MKYAYIACAKDGEMVSRTVQMMSRKCSQSRAIALARSTSLLLLQKVATIFVGLLSVFSRRWVMWCSGKIRWKKNRRERVEETIGAKKGKGERSWIVGL